MKKKSDKKTGTFTGRKKTRPCLMAYTLNNTQPVICTLVADQPFFYMEEDIIHEDDDILGLEEYANFEEDLAALKKKMDAYERMSKQYERAPSRRMEEFSAEAINITEAHISSEVTLLKPADKIISIINQSRMAKSLLDFAQTHSVYIVESEQVDGARYEQNSGNIYIHPALGEIEQALLAVRELRRHWQHRKGVLIHPLTFNPDQAILINRAQTADLTIAMIRSAWEMQLAGDRRAWDYIENSAMSDLGRAFAREAFVDFRSLASGKASSAVFETWFLSERCRHQDKSLISTMLADHQGYVFTGEDISRHVSIELITALGEQPFGKNYLAPYAQTIMQDPIFTEVRDRSNANFLWFIKFERSFRETEQALQSEEGSFGDDTSLAPSQPTAGKHAKNSTIIPLNASARLIHNAGQGADGSYLEEMARGTNIIHVRFGKGKGA